MTDRREILNVADIPIRTIHSGPRFEVALGDIDSALGTTQIGATLHVVPAGKTAWPYHRHHGNDELFYVLAGEGTYRVGDRMLPIKAGDLIGAPAGGEAHQLINTSDGELRYIAFANHCRADVIEYPDTGRIAVDIAHGNDKEPMSIFSLAGKMTPTKYWEDEDMGEGASND
ncbi:MAG: cupin domain-containing protein [Devosia sp.]